MGKKSGLLSKLELHVRVISIFTYFLFSLQSVLFLDEFKCLQQNYRVNVNRISGVP